MVAIKQFGVIRVIAFLRFSILKWWYSTDRFSCLRFRIRRWEPSFFGRMKTLEMYSPVECVVFSMIPLSRKQSIFWSMISTSNGLKLYWLGTKNWVGCSIKSIRTPLIALRILWSEVIVCHLETKFFNLPAVHELKVESGMLTGLPNWPGATLSVPFGLLSVFWTLKVVSSVILGLETKNDFDDLDMILVS